MEFGLVALWLVALLLLGLLALPLAVWLLGRTASAGALALPLGLAVLALVGYLVGHVAFGTPAALAGVLALGGLSALALVGLDGRPSPRLLVPGGVVFGLAFGLVVAIRALDPAAAPLPLAIGEKMLDFGLLAGLDRTGVLPPEDVWFAELPVRYYYGGHMTASLLGVLTDTAPRYTYNLALAGFYAALVAGVYGLARLVADPSDVSGNVAGGLAAFLVGVAGNLEPALRVLGWLAPDGLVRWVAGQAGLGNEVLGWTPAEFWYFSASRVVPVDPGAEETFAAATEFPLFSWLNGDLHAHMMSQPFLLLAAALLLAYWRTPPGNRRRRRLLLVGAVPPVAGLVGVTNVWSFPTAGGLTLLTVYFAPGDPATLLPDRVRSLSAPDAGRVGTELRRLGVGLAAAGLVLLLGILWTLPFWVGVIPGGPGKSPGLFDARTPLANLLVVHGAFVAVFALYVGRRLTAAVGSWPLAAGAGALVLAVLAGFPALGLVGPVGLAAWWLLRGWYPAGEAPGAAGSDDGVGFETMLVVAGAGLVLLVELVTVEGERFNVIFKTYSDIWLVWSVAGGVALARLAAGWPGTGLDVGPARRRRWRRTGTVLAVVVVLLTVPYAALALPSHAGTASPTADAEGPTLDATAYLEVEYPAEAAAIRWLNDRAGQPTIVTGAPGGYRWNPDEGEGSSAPASLTGLPTVLGWFHEQQYRGETPYERRLSHVESIYTTTNQSWRGRILDAYDVRYVYVGPAERARYGEIRVGDHDAVSVAREFGSVTVYRVRESSR